MLITYHPYKERLAFLNFGNIHEIDLLDVGVGRGALSILAAKKKHCIVKGIDINEKRLKITQKYLLVHHMLKKIQLEKQDICDLTFQNNSFTCVACFSTLHHIESAMQEKAIQEMVRVAKNRVIISELTALGAKYIDKMFHPVQLHQKNIITIEKMKNMVQKYGKVEIQTRIFNYFIRIDK